jgi:YesN/AraC family two-component response regulator
MSEIIRIFVVDDLRLLREGLVSLLAEQIDISVIGTAASSSKALEKSKNYGRTWRSLISACPARMG